MASFCGAQRCPATSTAASRGAAMRGAKRASTSRQVGPRAAHVCGANARPSPLVRCLGTSSPDGDDTSSSSSSSSAAAATAAAPAGSSKETRTVVTSKSKSTIDALSALLGNDAVDEEQKREEEADRLRAEKAALIETEKAKKEERLKAFRSVSVSTLRLQQLQMVFLDLPMVPKRLQGIFLNNNNNSTNDAAAAAAAAAATVADLPDTEWFDLALPSDTGGVVDKKTAADANSARRFGKDLTPEYIEYDGERLPGEFSIPVMPYPFVCHPGSQVRLNLFEPRWLTLFAKLMVEKPKKIQKKIDSKLTASGGGGSGESAAAAPSMPLVLMGARGENRIDLIRNKLVQAYEAGDDEAYDIVPGAGRMDETPFVGTRRFGAVYRRADGKVAGVGTTMKVAAHDVVVNGKLLSVYAKGETRFKVLRVRQVNPYLVVDAVPLLDMDLDQEERDRMRENPPARASAWTSAGADAGAWAGRDVEPEFTSVSGGGGGGGGGLIEGAFATNVGSSADFGDVSGSRDETGFGVGSPAAAQLAVVMERLIAADPYYSEAVGLGEAWNETSLQKVVRGMNEFDVANAVLYAHPETALRLLACTSRSKRTAATIDVVRGMEAAVAAGITPRKARLLRSAAAFSSLFAIGFSLAYVRDFVEQHLPNAGG